MVFVPSTHSNGGRAVSIDVDYPGDCLGGNSDFLCRISVLTIPCFVTTTNVAVVIDGELGDGSHAYCGIWVAGTAHCADRR